ncbi:MAG: AMP-binding protein [Motiliproteus sp.]
MQHDCEKLNRNLIERLAAGDILRNRSRDSGGHDAIVEFIDGKRIATSYRQLNQRVNQLVRGLRTQGLSQGDRLALLCSNTAEFVTVAFACYKAGMVLVPVNYLQTVEDVRYNLEHAEVKAVIYQETLSETALQASAALDQVQTRVVIGEPSEPTSITLESLISGQDDAEIEDIIIDDRDVATLLYTSGTTSRPKGVETSHKSLYVTSLSSSLSFNYQRHHRQFSVLPLFHCAAWSFGMMTLQLGGALVLQNQFNPQTTIDLFQAEKISSALLLPMMWRALLKVPGIEQAEFPALTQATYGMAPMDANSLEQLRTAFGCNFDLGSGQSEFTPVTTVFYDGTETEFSGANYWGIPTFTTQQAIIDDEGNEVAQGEQGEICWRGPQVMNGYLKNDQASKEARLFGWHHSSDLGMIDCHGQLVFVDRKKDMIKSGGENVASCKVEKALLNIPGVAQAAVFGVVHPHWIEAVCASVILDPGSDLDEADIIEACKQELGGFQVPKRVFIEERLPCTATGKIQKPHLRSQYKDLFV